MIVGQRSKESRSMPVELQSPGRMAHRLSEIRAVTLLALAASILVSLMVAWGGQVSLRGAENNIIESVIQLLEGRPLYTARDELPIGATQYGPIQYQLAAGIARLLGVGAEQTHALFLIARTLSLLFVAGSAALLFRLARSRGVSQTGAAVVAAGTLALQLPWAPLTRPDSASQFFGLLALWLADRERPLDAAAFAAMAAACAASFLCKQSGLAYVAGAGLVLLLARRWTSALLLAPAVALLIAGYLWLFSGSLGRVAGWALFANVDNGFMWRGSFLTKFLYEGFLRYGLVWGLWGALLWNWAARNPARFAQLNEVPLLAPMLVIATLFSVAATKVGSAENYFNDWIILIFLQVVWLAERQEIAETAQDALRSALSIFLIFLVAANFVRYRPPTALKEIGSLAGVAAEIRAASAGDKYVLGVESADRSTMNSFFRNALYNSGDVLWTIKSFQAEKALAGLPKGTTVRVFGKDAVLGPSMAIMGANLERMQEPARVCTAPLSLCIVHARYVVR